MTLLSTISYKRYVIAFSSFSESSLYRSKPSLTQRRLFVAKSFEPINLPKWVGKLIGKSNIKSMPVRHWECVDLGLEKYIL